LPIFLHLVGLLFLSHNFLSVKLPDAALSSFGFFHFVRLSFLLAAQNNNRAVSVFFSNASSFSLIQSTQCQRRKNTSRKSSSLALSFLSLSVKHIHAHKKHKTQHTGARAGDIFQSLSLSHHTVDAHEDASSWHQFSFFLPECSTVFVLFIFVSAPPAIFVRSWKKCVASALSCFPLKFLFLFLRFSWGLFVGVS